jgi:xylulokinase
VPAAHPRAGGTLSAGAALVGLDVGTSSLKAVAVSPDGAPVAEVDVPYETSSPRPGWSEQDPDVWVDAAAEALARLGRAPRSIGLSGQMHGLVALDGSDRVVRPAILWNDQRTEEECREIEERVGLDRLVAWTGNRALTGFTAPKILWLRRHESEAYARIRSVLLPKDMLRLRLTGERATDVTDASGTLLFDVGGRRWSGEVVEALALDPSWLPPALESPASTGSSPDGVVVAAGAGDQAAGAVGVGVVGPGSISVVLGTSGVVFAPLPAFAPDPLARVHTFCHAAPGVWHSMGVMLSAAASVRWLRDVVAPGDAYDALLTSAASWPPGADGLTFLPYLTGERTPHADPRARAAFTGLTSRHDRGALVRAVLEGVAFGLRDSFELIRESGGSPSIVRASGGGARSELWLRIVASVLGIPVQRMAVDAGAAYGAALLGGVACGAFASVQEAAGVPSVRSTIEPDPDWVQRYGEAYDRFRALYPALHPHARAEVTR